MRHYPLFIRLEGRSCLVVGAGRVGLRKIRSLLDCGASRLRVIECGPPRPELLELAALPGVELLTRPFEASDLDGVFLAIAATSDASLNARVARLCRERGILCNCVDAPEDGSFIVPSSVVRGDLCIAVSTGGQSPALTKRIRKDLQDAFGEEYAGFLALMGRLRPRVLALGESTEANSELFRALASGPLLEALKQNDAALARAELARLLPQQLHPYIPELLDGIA